MAGQLTLARMAIEEAIEHFDLIERDSLVLRAQLWAEHLRADLKSIALMAMSADDTS